VLGFCFSIRSGVLIAPAAALILWRGISARMLIRVAAGLLVAVVPVLYLATHVRDSGGYSFRYPVDLIDAHWVAVAGIVLLIIALWRTLRSARGGP
jgi:predicted membrane protein